jgi:hypothetical protein
MITESKHLARKLPILLVLSLLPFLPGAVAEGQQSLLEARIEGAATGGGASVQGAGGWPLTVVLSAHEGSFEGLAMETSPPRFPFAVEGDFRNPAFLVLENPDGWPGWLSRRSQPEYFDVYCSSPDPDPARCPGSKKPPWPRDETFLAFFPGISAPSPGDCDERPEMLAFRPSAAAGEGQACPGENSWMGGMGPCLGSFEDHFTYGLSRRLPGLVVLADSGMGLVLEEGFVRGEAAVARNLAGLFQSIAYELKDAAGRTSVRAHLNVPTGLLEPVVAVDVAERWGPDRFLVWRNGGAPTCAESWQPEAEHRVTVRAFAVAGRAPDQLRDADGDGDVDLADARATGLRPLSGEAVAEFRLVGEPGLFEPHFFDLDGNGIGPCPAPAPSFPGSVVSPPR